MARTPLPDLQIIMLVTACRRSGGNLLPWPRALAGQNEEMPKAVASLLRRRLIEEVEVTKPTHARRSVRNRRFGLVVTDAGRAVVAEEEGQERPSTVQDIDAGSSAAAPPESASPVPTSPTKQLLVIDLLQQADGASIAELTDATGWLPHTTRAALSGLRKKGHAIARDKVDGVTRYSLAAVA